MRRRSFVALGSQLLLAACSDAARDGKASQAAPVVRSGRWLELAFDPSEAYAQAELAFVAKEPGAPILVALHGRGESGRGLAKGAGGWRDDYWLDRADERLRSPPLTAKDFEGFVSPERLSVINASLAAEPYRGLNVVCPYAPHDQGDGVTGERSFAGFLVKVLLPRVRVELGADEAVKCAIDGVSMGGRLALYAGLTHPATFHGLGVLQPAINASRDDFTRLVELAAARAQSPKVPPLRLVSSEEDPFLEAVREFAEALSARGVPHSTLITPGPHNYAWNRGPGSIEMLLWHERSLRGLVPA
jgi:predicted esterase